MEAIIAITLGVAVAALVASLYAIYSVARVRGRITSILNAIIVNYKVTARLAEASRKPRRRYIVFEVQSTEPHGEKEVAKAIIRVAKEVLGEAGLTDSGIHVIAYYPERRIGVLRVKNTYKYQAMAILGMVRRIGGEPARIIPIYTSGTLKKALKRAGLRK